MRTPREYADKIERLQRQPCPHFSARAAACEKCRREVVEGVVAEAVAEARGEVRVEGVEGGRPVKSSCLHCLHSGGK